MEGHLRILPITTSNEIPREKPKFSTHIGMQTPGYNSFDFLDFVSESEKVIFVLEMVLQYQICS